MWQKVLLFIAGKLPKGLYSFKKGWIKKDDHKIDIESQY